MLKESKIVAIVPDRHDIQGSTKTEERIRRTGKCVTSIIDINDLTRLPKNLQQYLLSSPSNKINIVGYCFRRWKEALSAILLEEDVTYLAELNGSTTKIAMNQSLPTSLVCDRKETDSKMFVYCKMIKDLHIIERIVAHSPDTDFAVICCYHQLVTLSLSLRKLWFKADVYTHSQCSN